MIDSMWENFPLILALVMIPFASFGISRLIDRLTSEQGEFKRRMIVHDKLREVKN